MPGLSTVSEHVSVSWRHPTHLRPRKLRIIKTKTLALPQGQLSPDTDEERLRARDEMVRRRFRKGSESIDELARDLEKLLEKASPDLPPAVKSTELRYHLINAIPEKISFQLKLLPKEDYQGTISKAKELVLMYHRAKITEQTNQLVSKPDTDRLDQLEKAVQQVSEQLNALGTIFPNPARRRCLSVDNQDTWLGIVVSKDHIMLNAISVARKDILHKTAGCGETTKGMSLPVEQEIFPSINRCSTYRVCAHIIRRN